MVTLDELRALCGAGIAQFNAWASYNLPGGITRVSSVIEVAMRSPLRLIVSNPERWAFHGLCIAGRNFVSALNIAPRTPATAFAAGFGVNVIAGDVLNLDVEYLGDDDNGEQFNAVLAGQDSTAVPSWVNDGVEITVPSELRISVASNVCIKEVAETHVLIDLGGIVHRFEMRGGVIVRVCVVSDGELMAVEELIDANVSGIESVSPMILRPREPRRSPIVSLSARQLSDGRCVLFGVDESTNLVIFEVIQNATAATAERCLRLSANDLARCELAGYVPRWWDQIES